MSNTPGAMIKGEDFPNIVANNTVFGPMTREKRQLAPGVFGKNTAD